MFETLEVKDPREAAQRYKRMVEMEKQKWIEKLNKHDKDHAASMERKNLHIEDLESQLAQAKTNLQVGISREQYEKEWKTNKANVKKWEQVFKDREEQWKCDAIRAVSMPSNAHVQITNLAERKHSRSTTGSWSSNTASTRSTRDRCRQRISRSPTWYRRCKPRFRVWRRT
jgi:anti-sigma-K factor RskA